MAGGIFLTVTCGGGSRLCHGNDVPAYRDRRGSIRESRSFLEVLWSCLNDWREIGAAGCRGPLGRDDKAGLVRYANSSTNLRVLLLTG
jgi:hypothetical protein